MDAEVVRDLLAARPLAVVEPVAHADRREFLSEIDNFYKHFEFFCKILAGSFSAVSKPNFARKYAFDSIFQALFQALQDLHTSAPLQSQNFRKKSV